MPGTVLSILQYSLTNFHRNFMSWVLLLFPFTDGDIEAERGFTASK